MSNTALNAFLLTAGLAIATIGIGKSVANYQQLEYFKQFGPVQVYTLPSEPATGEYTSYWSFQMQLQLTKTEADFIMHCIDMFADEEMGGSGENTVFLEHDMTTVLMDSEQIKDLWLRIQDNLFK